MTLVVMTPRTMGAAASDPVGEEPPRGRVERAARWVCFLVSALCWLPMLPVCALMFVRCALAYGGRNLVSIFAGKGVADPANVLAVANLWPAGWMACHGILRGDIGDAEVEPLDVGRLFIELGLAVLLVALLLIMVSTWLHGFAWAWQHASDTVSWLRFRRWW